MSTSTYTIHYVNIQDVSFSTKRGIREYIKEEHSIWKDFLKFAESSDKLDQYNWNFDRRFNNKQSYFSGLNVLQSRLDAENSDSFNKATAESYRRVALCPPPSYSSEGQLIIGLWKSERSEHAVSAYLAFVFAEAGIDRNKQGHLAALIEKGEALLGAAYVAEALPFHRVSSQKISGAASTANKQVQLISDEVAKAVQINDEHKSTLSKKRNFFERRAKRLEKFILAREKRRGLEFQASYESKESVFMEFVEGQSKSFREFLALNKLSLEGEVAAHKEQIDKQNSRFKELQNLFMAQLRLKAPVALWGKRQVEHEKSSKRAFVLFMIFSIISVIIALGVPWLAGDYIADSFSRTICSSADASDCQLAFSAKGPLTITGLLVVTSLLLWLIRLQYRVFLSERHLALDAREKKAFAEAFLALKQDADVGVESEAIVLASLFRPTQDGIIRDNDNGMDLSAAAILAKQFSKVDK